MKFFLILTLMLLAHPAFAQDPSSALKATPVTIPGGEGGIGFDDMVYSSELQKVLVPAGHTGKLYIIDPVTLKMTDKGGFSSSAAYEKGHTIGISSADAGEGLIFVADHGRHELVAIDAQTGVVADFTNLAADADIVRYIGVNHEVWATEPESKQIEVFTVTPGAHRLLKAIELIPFPDGPEGLVVDHARGRVYTNLPHQTVAVDIGAHTMASSWPNGCEKSRVNALDERRGFLFVACAEGKASNFDLNNDNKMLSSLVTDPGPDVISYNAKLQHLYFTSSTSATLSVIKVSDQGALSLIAHAAADRRSHCVVGDEQDNIWVCDPPRGQLLRYKDNLTS